MGAHDMGAVKEKLRWNNLEEKPQEDIALRQVVQVPPSYGTLIHIGPGELWFRDKEGNLRNVRCGGTSLVKVLPVPIGAPLTR